MTTVILGDIHGSRRWEEAVDASDPWDQVIFVGDYFDDFTISGTEQLTNFKEILAFKRERPTEVTLLVGNHDFHYLPAAAGTDRYSGYQPKLAGAIREVLLDAAKDMTIATQVGDYLITHAGVSTKWLEEQKVEMGVVGPVESLQQVWAARPKAFKFYPGDHSDYGAHPRQGPLWVRPQVLTDYMAFPRQIVGHTNLRKDLDPSGPLVVIDTLPRGQFLLHTPQGLEVGQL